MSRPALVALRAAVSVAAMLLAWRMAAALGEQAGPLRLRPAWLGPILLLHLSILWLLAERLALMMRTLGGPAVPPPRERFRMALASLGVSQVALGTLSGDVVRVAMLSRGGLGWADAARTILLDRVVGLAGLVALGTGALVALLPAPQGPGVGLAGLGAAGAALLLAGGIAHAGPGGRVGGEAARLARGALRLAARPGGWACLGLALLSHALSVLLFYASARLVGLDPPMGETLVAVPAGLLVSTIPASLGGWGLREASIAATFRALGSEFTGAVLASIVYGLTHVAVGLAGLLSLWRGLGVVAPKRDRD